LSPASMDWCLAGMDWRLALLVWGKALCCVQTEDFISYSIKKMGSSEHDQHQYWEWICAVFCTEFVLKSRSMYDVVLFNLSFWRSIILGCNLRHICLWSGDKRSWTIQSIQKKIRCLLYSNPLFSIIVF